MINIRQLERRSRRYVVATGAIGLVGVAGHNVRRWRNDTGLLTGAQPTLGPPVSVWPEQPRVSVLVAAWNEARHIDHHIRSFLCLRYSNVELIICAGGNDDTLARANAYASQRVLVIEQHAGDGKQRALARCFQHATGDIMYLTDTDCRYNDTSFHRVLAPLVCDGEHVATGVSRPLEDQLDRILPLHIWAADATSSLRFGSYVGGLLGRNAALTRHALDVSGGMGFIARTGTDYQLAQRLLASGFRIRYVGASVVESEYPETVQSYRRKQSRWLRNLAIHGRRYGADDDVRVTQKTIATGLMMTLAPLFALLAGVSLLVPWLVLVTHAAAARVHYARLATGLAGRPLPLRYVAVVVPLTLLDFVVWALPLFDLCDPRRRDQW